MKEIVPDRLKRARLAKGWTRAKLSKESKVSTRQIKRVEDGSVSSRLSTVKRLAGALALDDGVLTGEAPMRPELRFIPIGNQINGDTLKSLRRARGWSRNQLHDESGVSAAQIRRIEGGEVGEIRHSTSEKLAKALGVGRAQLTVVEPALEVGSTQISARITPYVRLAFDLVNRQYGIGAKDVIQLAPLLFALAAERSLVARQANLDRVRADLDRVKESTTHFTTCEWVADADVATEQDSISAKDVLGHRFRERKTRPGANGPFENYLCSLVQKLDHPADVTDVMVHEAGGTTNTWGMGWYGVCQRMLYDLCGEDHLDPNHFSLARQALVVGAVRISDIPEELMTKEATLHRVKWLEDQFEHWCGDSYRELFEHMRSIRDQRDDMIQSEHEEENAWVESLRPTKEEEERIAKAVEERTSFLDQKDALVRSQRETEREIRSILNEQDKGMPGLDHPTGERHED